MGMVDLIWDSFGFVVCATLLLWFFFLKKTIFFLIDWASKKFFFLVGPRIRPSPLTGPGSGLGKKTRLVNGPGPDHRSWSVGQVRVWKNPIWTRPVAIPRENEIRFNEFLLKLSKYSYIYIYIYILSPLF